MCGVALGVALVVGIDLVDGVALDAGDALGSVAGASSSA
jgi:hypothetical protein